MVFSSYASLHKLLADADQQLSSNAKLSGEKQQPVVNSHVISATLLKKNSGGDDCGLDVKITLEHLQSDPNLLGQPICVYWDVSEEAWSDSGCEVLFTNSSMTVCKCDHLTQFALLAQPLVDDLNSVGSGIVFGGQQNNNNNNAVEAKKKEESTTVITLEIATYLVSTVCLLILILILIQVRLVFSVFFGSF